MDAVVKGTSISVASSEKAKALQAALAQIEKQFGKGKIMRLGEGEALEDIQVVSTGSLGLDIALGVGGLPRGRVIEIYGPESSGKTTLTLQVIVAWKCSVRPGYLRLRRCRAHGTRRTAIRTEALRACNLSATCSSASSSTPVSRRSRSSIRWFARARST